MCISKIGFVTHRVLSVLCIDRQDQTQQAEVCVCVCVFLVPEWGHHTALQATGFGLFHKCEEIEYVI
jgi:hypothetical protein